MDKLNFSFVVHEGFLETQSVLLVCSILHTYGDGANIFAGVPKHLGGVESGLTEDCKNTLKALGVEFFEVENPIGKDYPIGNKLDCFSWCEGGIKIFLDTDTILLQKLDLNQLKNNSMAMKPADRKTYKWSDEDWLYAYEKYSGVKSCTEQMFSTCYHELMHPYYNAGVIIKKGCSSFGSDWISVSKKVDKDDSLGNKRPWLDQLTLPLVVAKNDYHTVNLSEKYNFPAHLKPVPDDLPNIVHYHWANILCRDYQLLKYVRKLAGVYPVLLSVFSDSTQDWKDLYKLIKANRVSDLFNKSQDNKNVVLTGIPRSGTSYLCSLLSKYNDCFVLNEPSEIVRPINRQPTPYGVKGFYAETRKNIRLDKPIDNKHNEGALVTDTTKDDQRTPYSKADLSKSFHLYTKNTLGYMFGLERLKQTMPNSMIIALFRNPVDTIASWKNSFEHLRTSKPLELKTVRVQSRWLNKKEGLDLVKINACEDNILRRALFWNFLAIRLIKNAHLVKLFHYDDLILKTNSTLNQIRSLSFQEQIDIKLNSSDIRTKRAELDDFEIETIEAITMNTYSQLKALKEEK